MGSSQSWEAVVSTDGQGRPMYADRELTVEGSIVNYDNAPRGGYCSNTVISSKYTFLSFVPVNLFEQFSNAANMYFLIVGALQIVPAITTTDGIPTMYQPLLVIVMASAIRAATEDYHKHTADAQRNGKEYWALGANGWKKVQSGSIKVGQIIKVMKDEMIPADMVLIGSSELKGHCYIDKSNLNGETCLEIMQTIKATRKTFSGNAPTKGMNEFSFKLVYEPPTSKFDKIRGGIYIKDEKTVLNGHENLLMRETNLRNTDFIVGVVVYTGDQTKIQMSNAEGTEVKVKVSKIMRIVQQMIYVMVCATTILCFVGGLWAGIAANATEDDWYLDQEDEPAVVGILAFFTWFILLSQMVPISLIVSAEMVKLAMTIMIQWDIGMYYAPINKPTKVNNSTIHEDLGLVDYIFSDKTGTLTQNKMSFRYALLNDRSEFGSPITEIARAVMKRQAEMDAIAAGKPVVKDTTPWTELVDSLPKESTEGDPESQGCCKSCDEGCCSVCWVADPPPEEDTKKAAFAVNEFTERQRKELLSHLWCDAPDDHDEGEWKQTQEMLRIFMEHMALSCSVKPFPPNFKHDFKSGDFCSKCQKSKEELGVNDDDDDHLEEKNGDQKNLCSVQSPMVYQSTSAEETAMVNFSTRLGFARPYTDRPGHCELRVSVYPPDCKEFKPEDVIREDVHSYINVGFFPFSSARARVTLIYQLGDTIHCMLKGQDTMVLPLLVPEYTPDPDALRAELNRLCTNGLRTLVAGYAQHPLEWWQKWQDRYQKETTRPESEHSKLHKEGGCPGAPLCEKCAVQELYEEIERDAEFRYLGCIGLEDQLQLLVPQTIKDCLRAGINVWMITGDKLETAKNIGLACNLIEPDMQPQFKNKDLEDCVQAYRESRLIQITGQWAELVGQTEELSNLFDVLDTSGDGLVDRHEMSFCLRALKFGDDDKIALLMGQNEEMDKATFIKVMSESKLSTFEAVKYDINEGLKRWKAIAEEDREMFPISILFSRTAFLALFPNKGPDENKDSTLAEREELQAKFFELASVAKSVVFARAEPAMKKKMVTEIQARVPNSITLAIGDGANDCDMITAAHIGVGISGVEGTAAVNSADYAVGSFRLLHPLLFVHGFWNYHRIADLVNFIFYKAALVATSMYLFGFLSLFSGQQFFNDYIYQFYNVVFTALPVLAVAILDQQGVTRDTLQNNPQALKQAKGKAFTIRKFLMWIARAVLHAIVVVFVPYLAMAGENSVTTDDGKTRGLWFFSTCSYMLAVLIPTFMIMFDMNSITLVHMITVGISLVSVYLFVFLLSIGSIGLSFNPDLYGVVSLLYGDSVFWLVLFLGVSIPLLGEMFCRAVKRDLWPSFTNILQERIRLKQQELESQGLTHVSAEVTSHADDEKDWARRKGMKSETKSKGKGSSRVAATKVEMQEDSLHNAGASGRSAVIQAMLRFQNLTGSHFQSSSTKDTWDTAPMKTEGHDMKSGGASMPAFQAGDISDVKG